MRIPDPHQLLLAENPRTSPADRIFEGRPGEPLPKCFTGLCRLQGNGGMRSRVSRSQRRRPATKARADMTPRPVERSGAGWRKRTTSTASSNRRHNYRPGLGHDRVEERLRRCPLHPGPARTPSLPIRCRMRRILHPGRRTSPFLRGRRPRRR